MGLAFMSIREDEIAADAMGVNTTAIKVTAFVLSAFFAGVGGVLFAHAKAFKPDTFSFIPVHELCGHDRAGRHGKHHGRGAGRYRADPAAGTAQARQGSDSLYG